MKEKANFERNIDLFVAKQDIIHEIIDKYIYIHHLRVEGPKPKRFSEGLSIDYILRKTNEEDYFGVILCKITKNSTTPNISILIASEAEYEQYSIRNQLVQPLLDKSGFPVVVQTVVWEHKIISYGYISKTGENDRPQKEEHYRYFLQLYPTRAAMERIPD